MCGKDGIVNDDGRLERRQREQSRDSFLQQMAGFVQTGVLNEKQFENIREALLKCDVERAKQRERKR